jgi:hypothetical protein
MIDIGSTEFYIGGTELPRDLFEAYASQLFDDWDAHINAQLDLEDYAIILEVEEGSIKGKGKLLAGAVAIYAGICSYGSLVQGIDTIGRHAAIAGKFLAERAHASLGPNAHAPVVRKQSGTLGQLQRLFVRVQRRELSAEEATAAAAALIGEDAAAVPEFLPKISAALHDVQLSPLQIALPFEGAVAEDSPFEEGKRPPLRKPRPRPAIPEGNQVRVEIWRESKRGKKMIRVVDVG